MQIIINAIESCMDIPNCMTAEEIGEAALGDKHLSTLAELVIHSWPSTKDEVYKTCNHAGHSEIR